MTVELKYFQKIPQNTWEFYCKRTKAQGKLTV